MTLADDGFIEIGTSRLEYKMIGPRPNEAATFVLLHEGLGSVGIWGDFPARLAAATGLGGFAYSRALRDHGPAREAREMAPESRQCVLERERPLARPGVSQMGNHRGTRLYSPAGPHRPRRGRSIRHAAAGRGRQGGVHLPGGSRD